MSQYHIHFAGFGENILVDGGTVAEACRLAGHPLDLVCGGNGTCGKCDVTVERRGAKEVVRACTTAVDCDMTVFLPDAPAEVHILTGGEVAGSFVPMARKEYRPSSALEPEHCGAFLEKAPLGVLRRFSKLLRDRRDDGITFVWFGSELLDVQPGDTSNTLFGCAVDIGTTTVAMYIYDLTTGILLDTLSALNGQIGRGADVIARIQHTTESESGLAELNADILSTVNALLKNAGEHIPALAENLYHLVFCGNSTMQHLFLGLEPSALGVDPFANITAHGVTASAKELGLAVPECAAVDFLPLLGGFVGADTTAVLLGIPQDDKTYLAVDLGTNGEIAMGNGRKGFLTASTACGPALEGGCIDCGMRGTAGAIDKLSITPDGQVEYHVLGGGEAKGLCGSGIIDTMAALLRAGLVDETGRLLSREEFEAENPGSPLARRLGKLSEYNGVFYIAEGEKPVFLSQKDIRQIQLAKSSICAGCMTLATEYGIDVSAVDELILAGAFGNYIDIENALYIGLLPPVDRNKICPVGNGAGRGAQSCLLDKAVRARTEWLRAASSHLELNTSLTFMDNYIDQMNFYIE